MNKDQSQTPLEDTATFQFFMTATILPLILIIGLSILFFLLFSYICPIFLIKTLSRMADRKKCYTYEEKKEEAIRYIFRIKENREFWEKLAKPRIFYSTLFKMTYNILKFRYKNEFLYYKLKPEHMVSLNSDTRMSFHTTN